VGTRTLAAEGHDVIDLGTIRDRALDQQERDDLIALRAGLLARVELDRFRSRLQEVR